MNTLRNDPAAQVALGQPIREGWLPTGKISVSGQSGHAELAISVAGSQSSGTLYVIADKSLGGWNLGVLRLETGNQQMNIPTRAASQPSN